MSKNSQSIFGSFSPKTNLKIKSDKGAKKVEQEAKKESTSTGSAYGDKMRSNWERQQKKKESTNLRDRGYPSSTNPTSQPKTKASETVESKERSTGSAYGDKTRSDWERGQKKSTKNTLEAKEKAKTRNTIERVFKESTVKSAPPSKEEQEKMRRKGSRDAANMYSKNYSGRRG